MVVGVSISAPSVPATVTTRPSRFGSTAPKKTTEASSASEIPAMPPAGQPCGRTSVAEYFNSCASVVTNTRSSSPVVSSIAPATESPSLRVIASNTSRFLG